MQRLIWSWIYRIAGEVEMRKLCNRFNDWLLLLGFQMAVLVYKHVSRVCDCDPVVCSPPDTSVHGIFCTRILGGLPFPSPRDLAKQGIEPVSLALTGKFFSTEPPGKPYVRGLVTMNISSVWAGSCGMFLEQPLPQTLCLSSSLDYEGNSIWCRFPELLFTCEHPLHPKWKMLVQFRQFSRSSVRVRLFVTP